MKGREMMPLEDDYDDNYDRCLWIPACSTCAFMVVLLAPGLLSFVCPTGLTTKVNSVLCYRPLRPGKRRWWDPWTFDLVPAVRDMQVVDYLISLLWVAACFLMYLSPVGDLLGRVCVVGWATLLLPITKHSIWAWILGATFERYLKFHRWAARATFLFTLAHLLEAWYYSGLLAFTHFVPSKWMYGAVWGTVSFAIMIAITLLSLEPIRRRHFELFYYTHYLGLPAIAFAMMHCYAQCYAIIPSLFLYLVDKAVQLWSSVHTFQVQAVTPVAGGAQLVVRRKGAKLDCEPGQYYFLTLPTISVLEKHPMSVTLLSAEADTLTFFIRDMGPGSFTREVCQTNFPATATAQLTGPYGSLSLPRPLHVYRTVYLVAGGVGVTPMVSIAQSLTRLTAPCPKVRFVWISRDAVCFFEWFPAVLLELACSEACDLLLYHTGGAAPAPAPAPAAPAPVTPVLPAPARLPPQSAVVEMKGVMDADLEADPQALPADPPDATAIKWGMTSPSELATKVIRGRPDWTALFAPNATEGADVAVLTCGPEAMVEAVQRVSQKCRFHFHKETFLF
eukprot:EG_transcript_5355